MLRAGRTDMAFATVEPLTVSAPFSPAVRDALCEAVRQIEAVEAGRGEISRSARSALAPAAQPFQDFIDRVLFRLAGLTDAEAAGLVHRLGKML